MVWRHARLLHTDIEAGTCVVEWARGGRESSPGANGRQRLRNRSYDNLESLVASVSLDCVHLLDEAEEVDEEWAMNIEGDDELLDDDVSSSSSSSGEESDGTDMTKHHTSLDQGTKDTLVRFSIFRLDVA